MSKSEKLFEEKKAQIESAFEEFDGFYEKMDLFFKQKEVGEHELAVIGEMKDIVNTLDTGKNKGGYESWDGDDLTRAEHRLATLLLSLGEVANNKAQKANVMGRYVKWRRHNEWNPAKQFLQDVFDKLEKDKQKRLIKEDIEAEVSKRIFADNIIEAMMAGHADILLTLFDSTKSVLTALAHRINLKKDERQLNRK